jgi:hypothetical protein
MVMDFEDGLSLSRMLKQGRRFNERSLWNILQPIAEGLERAHRVGVLHRDIKPPNILINEDNRPVLIDFGSARFEAAEATSTKVTFHTPPYAAIEQYVKTYPQGPWTDIYALGVVMYECITGEKPPEVLERLHAGLGKPLASGKWPGYGKKFLAAVDAAMIVKPEERPQSLSDWLKMFGKIEATDTADDEATRFYSQQVESEEIVPVPPTPNVDPKAPVSTGVPKDPKAASFKRAGEETGAKKKAVSEAKAAEPAKEETPKPAAGDGKAAATAAAATAAAAEAVSAAEKTKPKTPPPAAPAGPKEPRKKPSPMIMAAAAAGLIAVVGVGAIALRGGGSQADGNAASVAAIGTDNSTGTLAAVGPADATTDVNAAATNAPTETMPVATATQPTDQTSSTQELAAEKAKTAAAQAQLAALKKAQAKANATEFASANPSLPSKKNGKTTIAEITSTPDAAVSSATVSQFNSAISDARSMAKQVMRSGSGQNVQLAKNYDSYLKTLQDSMRGIQSEKEAQKLLKQANQTRQYIVFLQKQTASQ